MKTPYYIILIVTILVVLFGGLYILNNYLANVIKAEDPKETPTQAQRNFITERDEYCKANPSKCKGYGK